MPWAAGEARCECECVLGVRVGYETARSGTSAGARGNLGQGRAGHECRTTVLALSRECGVVGAIDYTARVRVRVYPGRRAAGAHWRRMADCTRHQRPAMRLSEGRADLQSGPADYLGVDQVLAGWGMLQATQRPLQTA